MLNIVKEKGCKRCGGDLFLEKDAYGPYISCLQCGAAYFRRETLPYKKARERKLLLHVV